MSLLICSEEKGDFCIFYVAPGMILGYYCVTEDVNIFSFLKG
jgi:hypothetical protein